MTRILRLLVVGFGLLMIATVVVGAFMPRTWGVERARTVRASPERVQGIVEDLRTWEGWTPWSKTADATAVFTFDGPPSGTGARMSFEGQLLGFGDLTIVRATPAAGIEYELRFRGVEQVAKGTIALAPDPAGTRVVWKVGGELGWNPIQRLFSPLLGAKLGSDFDAALGRLSLLAEAPR